MPKNRTQTASTNTASKIEKEIGVMKKMVRKSVTEGKPLKNSGSNSVQDAREIEMKLAMIENQLTQTTTQPDGRKSRLTKQKLNLQLGSLKTKLK